MRGKTRERNGVYQRDAARLVNPRGNGDGASSLAAARTLQQAATRPSCRTSRRSTRGQD